MDTQVTNAKLAGAARAVYEAATALNQAMRAAAELGISCQADTEPARSYVHSGVFLPEVKVVCTMVLSGPLLTRLIDGGQ